MHGIIVRTLSHELRLRSRDPNVLSALMAFRTEPLLPGRELKTIDLDIEPVGRFFRIEPPGFQATEGSLEAIAHALFRLKGALWRRHIKDLPVVHAAVAIIGGRRIVFVGDKGAGKTTLMLRLVQEGHAVHGDESLILEDEGPISYPRCLHVKETSLDILPGLSNRIRSMPSVTDWFGNVAYICPPSFLGGEWTITPGAIDDLVFLEPNFGGSSILSSLSREDSFARLIEFSFLPETGRARAAARLRNLAVEGHCWRLQTGNLDEAVARLRRLYKSAYKYMSQSFG